MSASPPDRDPLDEIAEVFVSRLRRGEKPSLSEYTGKYPALAAEIRVLFPALVVMEDLGPEIAAFPSELEQPAGAPLERIGEYRILREIGRGGMGIVYEAVQESLGRHVALKILPLQATANPLQLERFRREARAAARLHHTNIVPVFGIGESQGIHYYAMQFIRGQSLDAVLKELRRQCKRREAVVAESAPPTALTLSLAQGLQTGFGRPGRASEELGPDGAITASPPTGESASSSGWTATTEPHFYVAVARLGAEAADALDYAHQQGILHRDIKPGNLLLDAAGGVWITDFGLAKAGEGAELTNPGDVVGTVRYMAPERFRGQADARTDVYGLGITLYEMLTLRRAFDEADKARLIERVSKDSPTPPRKIDSRIPRDLETVVLKAIAREPRRRYATAAEFAADLRRYLGDRPILARRTSRLEQGWRLCRRNPMVAGLSAAVLSLLILLGVGSVFANVRLGERLQQAIDSGNRATTAEQEKAEQLRDAYLAGARAKRSTRKSGQQWESLAMLAKAAAIRPGLDLRNEAIQCLTLTDLLPPHWLETTIPREVHQGSAGFGFDETFEHYALCFRDGAMVVRSTADHRELGRLPGTGKYSDYLIFSPDGRWLAAHSDGDLRCRVWEWQTGRLTVDHRCDRTGLSVSFRADSKRVALAGLESSAVDILELPSRKSVQSIKLPFPTDALVYDPAGGKRLAVCCRQGRLAVLDADLGSIVHEWAAAPPGINFLAWQPGGNLLAAAREDGRIVLYDWAARQVKATLDEHHHEARGIYFNPAGDLLLSDSFDRTVRLWDPNGGRELLQLEETTGYGFDRTGQRIAVRNLRRAQIGYCELAPRTACRSLHGHQPLRRLSNASVAFAPDNRLLATAGWDGIRVWDMTRSKQAGWLGRGNSFGSIFTPKGDALLTSGEAGLEWWPLLADPEGKLTLGPQKYLHLPRAGRFTSVSQSNAGTVALMDYPSQVLVANPDQPPDFLLLSGHGSMDQPDISPDGRFVVTTRQDEIKIQVWNALNGRLLVEMPGEVGGAALTPDSRHLIVCDENATRCFSAGDWRLVWQRPETEFGWKPIFLAEGKLMQRQRLRITETETGVEVATLSSPEGQSLAAVNSSADGQFVGALASRGTVFL